MENRINGWLVQYTYLYRYRIGEEHIDWQSKRGHEISDFRRGITKLRSRFLSIGGRRRGFFIEIERL